MSKVTVDGLTVEQWLEQERAKELEREAREVYRRDLSDQMSIARSHRPQAGLWEKPRGPRRQKAPPLTYHRKYLPGGIVLEQEEAKMAVHFAKQLAFFASKIAPRCTVPTGFGKIRDWYRRADVPMPPPSGKMIQRMAERMQEQGLGRLETPDGALYKPSDAQSRTARYFVFTGSPLQRPKDPAPEDPAPEDPVLVSAGDLPLAIAMLADAIRHALPRSVTITVKLGGTDDGTD